MDVGTNTGENFDEHKHLNRNETALCHGHHHVCCFCCHCCCKRRKCYIEEDHINDNNWINTRKNRYHERNNTSEADNCCYRKGVKIDISNGNRTHNECDYYCNTATWDDSDCTDVDSEEDTHKKTNRYKPLLSHEYKANVNGVRSILNDSYKDLRDPFFEKTRSDSASPRSLTDSMSLYRTPLSSPSLRSCIKDPFISNSYQRNLSRNSSYSSVYDRVPSRDQTNNRYYDKQTSRDPFSRVHSIEPDRLNNRAREEARRRRRKSSILGKNSRRKTSQWSLNNAVYSNNKVNNSSSTPPANTGYLMPTEGCHCSSCVKVFGNRSLTTAQRKKSRTKQQQQLHQQLQLLLKQQQQIQQQQEQVKKDEEHQVQPQFKRSFGLIETKNKSCELNLTDTSSAEPIEAPEWPVYNNEISKSPQNVDSSNIILSESNKLSGSTTSVHPTQNKCVDDSSSNVIDSGTVFASPFYALDQTIHKSSFNSDNILNGTNSTDTCVVNISKIFTESKAHSNLTDSRRISLTLTEEYMSTVDSVSTLTSTTTTVTTATPTCAKTSNMAARVSYSAPASSPYPLQETFSDDIVGEENGVKNENCPAKSDKEYASTNIALSSDTLSIELLNENLLNSSPESKYSENNCSDTINDGSNKRKSGLFVAFDPIDLETNVSNSNGANNESSCFKPLDYSYSEPSVINKLLDYVSNYDGKRRESLQIDNETRKKSFILSDSEEKVQNDSSETHNKNENMVVITDKDGSGNTTYTSDKADNKNCITYKQTSSKENTPPYSLHPPKMRFIPGFFDAPHNHNNILPLYRKTLSESNIFAKDHSNVDRLKQIVSKARGTTGEVTVRSAQPRLANEQAMSSNSCKSVHHSIANVRYSEVNPFSWDIATNYSPKVIISIIILSQ